MPVEIYLNRFSEYDSLSPGDITFDDLEGYMAMITKNNECSPSKEEKGKKSSYY